MMIKIEILNNYVGGVVLFGHGNGRDNTQPTGHETPSSRIYRAFVVYSFYFLFLFTLLLAILSLLFL